MVARLAASNAQDGPARDRTLRDLDGALRARCAELTGALKYAETETADILDRALAAWIDERSHVTLRARLFPRR